ncbi:hypothetical protein [Pelagibacterium mangrovi]|uniref:hypothetical protein n=1 Tax=Pelagibacterium mangrovi TaxID=3119828 RepID=UPI002FC6D697
MIAFDLAQIPHRNARLPAKHLQRHTQPVTLRSNQDTCLRRTDICGGTFSDVMIVPPFADLPSRLLIQSGLPNPFMRGGAGDDGF